MGGHQCLATVHALASQLPRALHHALEALVRQQPKGLPTKEELAKEEAVKGAANEQVPGDTEKGDDTRTKDLNRLGVSRMDRNPMFGYIDIF